MILERLSGESFISEMLRSLKEVMLASRVSMDYSRLQQLGAWESNFSRELRGDCIFLAVLVRCIEYYNQYHMWEV